MFSREERCIYRNSPLAEVICQLRFPEILSIAASEPAAFQECIRDEYPEFRRLSEPPAPRIPGNHPSAPSAVGVIWEFRSPDGAWRIHLTSKFISLICTEYTGWDEFAKKLDKPLASFIKLYKPAYFQRIGLRYLNAISRQRLGLESFSFAELIAPRYVGPLGDPDVTETAFARCTTDFEVALTGACRLRLHAGPGILRGGMADGKEVSFILDQDLFVPGQVNAARSAEILQLLHRYAWSVFRGAITDTLHEAMEPLP